MARRRLSAPDPERLAEFAGSGLETKSAVPFGRPEPRPSAPAPIARVAGEAAAAAAVAELAAEITLARDEGRLVQAMPLEAVDESYLVRDRLGADEEALQALADSIRERGQQVPIEVVALPDGRFGLLTGWRRLTALRRLQAQTPDEPRFGKIWAVRRRPETAAQAYRAMVEENELRVGLSYYERARIVARAVEQGVFPDTATALSRLFATASRPKRSKIGSFLRLYAALDDHLRFPAAIPERLGLALVKALDADKGAADSFAVRLRETPAKDPTAEVRLLESLPRQTRPAKAAAEEPRIYRISQGLRLTASAGRLELKGVAVTEGLEARLVAWLQETGQGAD